jgi:uncharacterized delta-60 repeat protein
MKLSLFILLATLTIYCRAQAPIRDLTFGNAGVVTTPFNVTYSYGHSVIQQSNGKIIAAGSQGPQYVENMFVVRYNTDGTIDTSFGVAGFLVDSLTSVNGTLILSMAEQHDGKIVAAGRFDVSTIPEDIFIIRFDSSGIVDPTFGHNGRIIADYQGHEGFVSTIKIQPDGKLVLAGAATDTINYDDDIMLMRFNSDGSPDTTFGMNGVATADYNSSYEWANSMILQQDGKIVIAGISDGGSSQIDALIARFLPDGSKDLSFHSGGHYLFDNNVGDDDGFATVAINQDGKIIAGGISYDTNGDQNGLIIQLDTSGNPDPTFHSNGILIKNYSGEENEVDCIVIQPDGKIMTVGYKGYSSYDILLSRYLSNGSSDPTFGGSGYIVDTISPDDDIAYSAIFQSDQKIVITGTYLDAGNEKFFLARYLNDSLINYVPVESIQTSTLFPQPTNDRLNISNLKSDMDAEVLDLNGQIVLKYQRIGSQIDVSPLSSGMYFLRLTNDKNVISTFKFVKM